MKKLFNYRPAALLLLFFCFGIASAYGGIKYSALPLTAFCVLISAYALIIIYLIYKKKFSIKITAHMIIFLFAAFCGYFLFLNSINRFENNQTFDGVSLHAEGEIVKSRVSENGGYFIVEDAVFTVEGQNYSAGTLFVYIYGTDGELDYQGRISFSGKANAANIYEGGKINSYAYRNKIKYNFYINQGDYVISRGNPSIFLKVKQHIKNLLFDNMRNDNARLSYALVTGDSLLMDSDLKQAFIDSGTAHIFCVSGLHIGVLAAAAIYALNKLKANRYLQLVIITAILLFYGAVCGFPPSVIRAGLMTELYLLTKCVGIKYDILSSLCVAAIIILLAGPLMLFDAGFLLSFFSVLAIALLYSKLNGLFKVLPAIIRAPLCVTISAQAGVLPLLAVFYNKICLLSICANIMTVPVVGISYVSLLILIIITSILPVAGQLLFFPQGLLEIIKFAAIKTASINASLNIYGLGRIATALYYVLLIVLSRYVFISIKPKSIISISLCGVIIFSTVSYNAPFSYNNISVSSVDISNINSSIITADNNVYYINYGNREDAAKLKDYLNKNKIANIECVFFTDYENAAAAINSFSGYGIKKYILPYSQKYKNTFSHLEAEGKIKYLATGEVYTYKNIAFSAYYFNGNYCGGAAFLYGKKVLYINDSKDDSLSYITQNFADGADMVFCADRYSYINLLYNPSVLVTPRYTKSDIANLYSSGVSGSLIFEIKDDKINLKYAYRQY